MNQNSLDLVIKSNFCQVTVGAEMPSKNYVTKVALEEFGLSFGRTYPLFLIDLYTLFSHHEVCVELDRDYNVDDIIYSKKTIVDYCAANNIDFTNDLDNFYKMSSSTLKQVDPTSVRGYSPLTKALSVLVFVANAPKNNDNREQVIQDYELLVNDKITMEGLSNLKNYDYKAVQSSNDGDLINPYTDDNLTMNIGETIRDYTHSVNPVIKSIIQENPYKSIAINKAFISMMKASMYLKDQIGIGNKSLTETDLTNQGTQRRTEMMTSYNQVNKTSMVSRMLPTYKAKVFKKELSVKEKVEPKKSKQGVLFLTDDSGSMQLLWKQSYIRAAALKFLEQVALGNAEVEHVNYTYSCYGSTIANDLASAQAMYKKINQNIPQGSGTNIAAVLQEQIDILVGRNDLINKEIFILLDGQDSLNPDHVDTKGIVINSLCLGVNNDGVRKVCEKSGGVFKAIVIP